MMKEYGLVKIDGQVSQYDIAQRKEWPLLRGARRLNRS